MKQKQESEDETKTNDLVKKDQVLKLPDGNFKKPVNRI
jgi:hypothetical protein